MKRLYRSRSDRMVAGVAGGLADYLNIDPTIVRLVWVLLLLPGGVPGLLPYIICWVVVPEEPAGLAAAPGVAAGRAPLATPMLARDEPVATKLPLADPDPRATKLPLARDEPTATLYDTGSAKGGEVPGLRPRSSESPLGGVPPVLEADAAATGSPTAGTTQPSAAPAPGGSAEPSGTPK